MTATLIELNTYPLKSGGGTSLESAELTATGLPLDREFMLVTPEGRFLSQRDLAEMALMRPSYDGEILTVDVPDAAPLVHKAAGDGEVLDVVVQRKECQGVDQGDEAAAWFSSLLGQDCRLVRFTGHRPTSRGGGEVMFADGYPLLLISAESLADLNARLDVPLPMNRFRPSLVIEGLGAFAEDTARLLRVGETVIEAVKPCSRCVITTTDQETAERGREPLRTLAAYRSRDRGIQFGQNCVPRTLGTLALGDPVEVLEAR
ncbi:MULTISPECIES: MOSC domain-containing protein [unclassified Spirillospora]|uniref:MOSC domain-containing protein n=1 Tax=unclassified Spirillospora TaxID=2642701 RepID=UPI0037210781